MRPSSCRTTDARRRAARPAPPTTARDHDPRSQGCLPSRPHRPGLPARPHRADARWCGDITYVPTEEGWLYLATVINIASRRVAGWATADHLRTELAAEALTAACQQRRPTHPVIFHSDRGCQLGLNRSSQHQLPGGIVGAR
ncbi:DDE-type integrase/transposase/recombinase [Streptomyces sp. NPDC060022]|uniref:DDE-type integrase/transposase/recombinase n=1 Tax=Streptomyces sp. NPDC060022 TaxID=3347039 RepID=UPI00368C43DF